MSESSEERTIHEEFSERHPDPLIRSLHRVIRLCVKLMSILMALVILFGVADVMYVMWSRLMQPPVGLLGVSDIFAIFGAFMVVLIAIEIFINIRLYLGTRTLPIKLVIATALMAIARKVIVLDLSSVQAIYVFAIAAVVLSLGVTYWLISQSSQSFASSTTLKSD
ncbi:hypothetical protein E4634_07115 [Mangrovimicrobium sediminis]|uniref:Protein PsiE n=1 Tax=Mangrovimicrobium sediminis TaxID=2562682 RepID=A0A4Z0M381_9GAMM|nr:phosphate-starvation-inducible PsiE family protein [Haliea sp. SAOS-164]TGD73904.1 hypothetical protein E4634_07115 [Haliea sp. SAOS-164]